MANDQTSRRLFLGQAATIGAASAANTVMASAMQSLSVPLRNEEQFRSDVVVAKDNLSIVETRAGKVRGFMKNGIHVFRGVPYGASTGGASRFMPPKEPEPWTGIRSSLYYGHVSPFTPRTRWSNDEEAFMFQWNDGQSAEDCLHINVWTPGLHNTRKRPVMVWLHGGAFAYGSGQELRSYDGENLSKRNDVVVVTLNHRLNAFGFLNLAEHGGEQFAASGNVGMLDLVLALEWVRDNITAFGGDPGSVMIFGQSGGGGKVSTLMGMPSAKGLFHRAVIQSGSMLRIKEPEDTYRMTALVLAELNIARHDVKKLKEVSIEQLMDAGLAAERKMIPNPADPPDFRNLMEQLAWAPVVDGSIVPVQPFDPHAPASAVDIPMIIGSTLNEFVNGINDPDAFSMKRQQLTENLNIRYGSRTEEIIETFQREYPNAAPYQLYSIILASSVRSAAVEQARRKTMLKGAPVYLYHFTWQTPILDGRPLAFHCSDLAFCWDNVARCDTMTGGGAEANRLASVMSESWASFAHTGNPNHKRLQHWPVFDEASVPTKIFDNECLTKNDPDGASRRLMDSLARSNKGK
jgi:para-nitrobenzyl esterase